MNFSHLKFRLIAQEIYPLRDMMLFEQRFTDYTPYFAFKHILLFSCLNTVTQPTTNSH